MRYLLAFVFSFSILTYANEPYSNYDQDELKIVETKCGKLLSRVIHKLDDALVIKAQSEDYIRVGVDIDPSKLKKIRNSVVRSKSLTLGFLEDPFGFGVKGLLAGPTQRVLTSLQQDGYLWASSENNPLFRTLPLDVREYLETQYAIDPGLAIRLKVPVHKSAIKNLEDVLPYAFIVQGSDPAENPDFMYYHLWAAPGLFIRALATGLFPFADFDSRNDKPFLIKPVGESNDPILEEDWDELLDILKQERQKTFKKYTGRVMLDKPYRASGNPNEVSAYRVDNLKVFARRTFIEMVEALEITNLSPDIDFSYWRPTDDNFLRNSTQIVSKELLRSGFGYSNPDEIKSIEQIKLILFHMASQLLEDPSRFGDLTISRLVGSYNDIHLDGASRNVVGFVFYDEKTGKTFSIVAASGMRW
ncbi:MAG: hypothetical protein AB7F43_06215 [Bacteriovoracia bacterium]